MSAEIMDPWLQHCAYQGLHPPSVRSAFGASAPTVAWPWSTAVMRLVTTRAILATLLPRGKAKNGYDKAGKMRVRGDNLAAI
jgi:hypothetical protein